MASPLAGIEGGDLERAQFCRQVAEESAAFLLYHLQSDAGRLFHSWKAGSGDGNQEGHNGHKEPSQGSGLPRIDGFLEDYANLAVGLLALYQATFDPRWYQAAHNIVDAAIARFWVAGEGFFDTASDPEQLVARPRNLQDNATPSGNAMRATVLLKLSSLAVAPRCAELARQNLTAVQDYLPRAPLGFGQWLQVLAYALSKPREIAIVGDPDSADTQALLSVVRESYRPFQVVALAAPDAQPPALPLLQDRGLVKGQAQYPGPAAYVCRAFACQAPVTEPEVLRAQLEPQ